MIKRLLQSGLLVGLITVSLFGCAIDSTKVAEYNTMKSIQEYRDSDIDMYKYDEAVLAIADSNIIYSDTLQNVIDNYSDILDDDMVRKLQGEVVAENSSVTENEEESLDNPYNNVEVGKSGDEYTLYGTQYAVVGYGTKEEAQEYIDNFNALQENTIQEADWYNNMVVYKLENKYLGSFLMQFELNDGKLHSYTKFEILRGDE